jgi:hypothetical protein
MKRWSILSILIALFVLQAACSLFTARPGQVTPPAPSAEAPTAAAPSSTPASATQPSTASPIDLALLKNFTYWVPDFNTQVPLTDGVFSSDQFQSRLVEPAALGDVNGDGQADAAVVLVVDPSGSGTFYYLTTLLAQNGPPVQSGFASIGDRQGINNLAIANGRVVLDYVTQGPNDPLCCASQHRLRSYVLENGTLLLASEQVLDGLGTQADPLPNAILIDQPAAAALLTTNLRVRGRVSQVPPEGKLAYSLTGYNAVLLAQGEVPLDGAPGGAGSFDFEINLAPQSPGLVQLELVDAADGVLRGRSVVELVAQ